MKIFFVSLIAVLALANQPPFPTDPQIAGVMVSANSEKIENAVLAKNKSKNTAIKQYAEAAIHERRAANKAAGDLADKLRIAPEENEITRALKKSTQKTRSKLKRLNGTAFDKAYVDGEVELHQMLLDLINNSLIPGARNPDLTSMLQNDRPLIEAHLEYAKQLQSKIK